MLNPMISIQPKRRKSWGGRHRRGPGAPRFPPDGSKQRSGCTPRKSRFRFADVRTLFINMDKRGRKVSGTILETCFLLRTRGASQHSLQRQADFWPVCQAEVRTSLGAAGLLSDHRGVVRAACSCVEKAAPGSKVPGPCVAVCRAVLHPAPPGF